MLTVDCCQNGCEVYYYLKYVNDTKGRTIYGPNGRRGATLTNLRDILTYETREVSREGFPHPLTKGAGTVVGSMRKSPLFQVATRRFARESSAWGDEMENVRSPDLGILPGGGGEGAKLVVNASV